MTPPLPVSYSSGARGVGWIVFDQPGTRANVLNPPAQDALASALDAAEADAALTALVLISGKERIFIAGADLKQIAALRDEATAVELARRGQKLLQRLAEFRVPIVAAIHGACAGGGFELALACEWRIATDARVTQIGLPETSIGVIPGWGGTVRLPRLVGVPRALELILRGQLVSAQDALASGLIDEVVTAGELRERAEAAALKLSREDRPPRNFWPLPDASFFAQRREAVQKKTLGHQPAFVAAIDAVEETAAVPMTDALEIEARHFARLATSRVCKNLLHAFFLRDAAKKRTLDGWFDGDMADRRFEEARPPIRRVGVIGAGVMGSGIAHWLASHGFEVVLGDVNEEALSHGMTVIRGLFDGAGRRQGIPAGEAAAGLRRITTTTRYAACADCDLLIEAIVEDVGAKRALFAQLADVARQDAIFASNTSALPLEEIGAELPDPTRLVGIHFFNPVSRMPLVELIVGQRTSAETAARALALVKTLGKTPVLCRSSPGFLVTRVLFFYLNEAVRQWEQGTAASAIDAALRDFGWPMGPLRLIDEVGVDVTNFIFSELAHYFPERFAGTKATAAMVAANLKGRKNGASRGFYRYAGKGEELNDREARALVRVDAGLGRATGGEEITRHLMSVMVDEAERCLAEGVVKSADDVDFALLSGAGFPAFRGGLLRWARARDK